MSHDALTLQLLQWIGNEPRDYRESIEAWRTSCPRLTIWEDAMSDGLIERVPGACLSNAQVRVTESGKAHLESVHASAQAPADVVGNAVRMMQIATRRAR